MEFASASSQQVSVAQTGRGRGACDVWIKSIESCSQLCGIGDTWSGAADIAARAASARPFPLTELWKRPVRTIHSRLDSGGYHKNLNTPCNNKPSCWPSKATESNFKNIKTLCLFNENVASVSFNQKTRGAEARADGNRWAHVRFWSKHRNQCFIFGEPGSFGGGKVRAQRNRKWGEGESRYSEMQHLIATTGRMGAGARGRAFIVHRWWGAHLP